LSRCEAKFAKIISTNALLPPIPSCRAAAPAPPTTCVGDQSIAASAGAQSHDSLNRDCDLFDDGTDNDSCANVLPDCGDGIAAPGSAMTATPTAAIAAHTSARVVG
jgi:hypothetical protein